MKNQFIRKTSGWIPVSVLVLFAIALVAGQARANLPNEIKGALLPAATATTIVVLRSDMSSGFDALPVAIDTLSVGPSELEAGSDAGITSLRDSADRLSLQNSQTASQ